MSCGPKRSCGHAAGSTRSSRPPSMRPMQRRAGTSAETEETMFYDAAKRDHGLAQDPLKSLIVPRPIGWISTVDKQGRVNLAPYSFYNGVSEYPPMVYFAITGTYGDNPTKQSRMNAEETGDFVVNRGARPRIKKMTPTSERWPRRG